jgi:hypothetical protein
MIVPLEHAPAEGCPWLGPGRCQGVRKHRGSSAKSAGQPKQMAVAQQLSSNVQGGPGKTRTCDLRFRKPLLYPAELRDQASDKWE